MAFRFAVSLIFADPWTRIGGAAALGRRGRRSPGSARLANPCTNCRNAPPESVALAFRPMNLAAQRLWVAFSQRTIIIIVVLASAPLLVAVIRFMITARQSRAARALLGWNQETLADKAQVSLTALRRLESESGLRVYESTRDQVRRALEGNGIVFMSTEKGEGVMVMRNANATESRKRP